MYMGHLVFSDNTKSVCVNRVRHLLAHSHFSDKAADTLRRGRRGRDGRMTFRAIFCAY